MNQFLCNIGKNLSKEIPNTGNPLLQYKYPINKDTYFEFRPARVGELKNVLGKFKTSAGFYVDDISSQFVRTRLPITAESL